MLISLIALYLFWETPKIENGFAPTDEAQNLILKEDLRFGGGDVEDIFIWSGANPTVTADPKGNMYVADTGSNRILVFDPMGKYLQEFARKGEGPGEYRMLNLFTVFEDGSGLGLDVMGDSARFLFYDQSLKYQKDAKIEKGHIYRAHFSPNGKYMSVLWLSGFRETIQNVWGVMDTQFNWQQQLNTLPLDPWDRSKLDDRDYLMTRFGKLMAIEMGPRGVVGMGAKGSVFTAVSNKYEITKWSADLKTREQVIVKKHKPAIRSEAEIDALIGDFQARMKERVPPLADRFTLSVMEGAWEKSGLPPVKNPLFGLLVLPNNFLIVVHTRKEDHSQVADLFDNHGVLIGNAVAPNGGFWDTDEKPRMSFRGPFAYTIETVDEEHQVVRYRWSVGK